MITKEQYQNALNYYEKNGDWAGIGYEISREYIDWVAGVYFVDIWKKGDYKFMRFLRSKINGTCSERCKDPMSDMLDKIQIKKDISEIRNTIIIITLLLFALLVCAITLQKTANEAYQAGYFDGQNLTKRK